MTGEQKSAEGGLEQWDLTNKNSAYLDRHMMFPLLEYLDGQIKADKISYSSKDVAAARLALLRPTHMVDYAVDTYKSVHGESAEIPQEMEEQKKQVFKQLEELESGCKPLTDLCNNAEEKVSNKYVTFCVFVRFVIFITDPLSHIHLSFLFSLNVCICASTNRLN